MYVNTGFLMASGVQSKLILFDFFDYIFYGYYGHMLNLITLIFSKDSFIYKLYKLDKLQLVQTAKSTPISILRAREGSISILGSLMTIGVLVFVLFKRNQFLKKFESMTQKQI
jgi:hypothetical protein